MHILLIEYLMQRERVEAESVTYNYYNSSTKPKFYKNTRLAGKIIEKTSASIFFLNQSASILLTISVTDASAKRSFSKLKLIKSYLRSTMSQERLSGLLYYQLKKKC